MNSFLLVVYNHTLLKSPNHQILCHLSSYLQTLVIFGTSLTAAINLAHNALPGIATLWAKLRRMSRIHSSGN